MKEIMGNITETRTWLERAPRPEEFTSEDFMMDFLVEEVMSRSKYLIDISASLVPSEKVATVGYTKHKAVILGHMIRLVKLYDGFCIHVAKRQLELAQIFTRLIIETSVRMQYLLKCGHQKQAIRSFIFTSYRAERQSIKDLIKKRSERKLICIEKRMLRSMMRHLKEDGITFKELEANRNWKVDGKDMAAILNFIGRDQEYSYGFGGSSRSVHGNWMEMRVMHLKKKGAYYLPILSYSDPDPRIVCPVTIEVLSTSIEYLEWSKADPDGLVKNLIKDLIDYNFEIDAHHEKIFMKNKGTS